MNCQIHTKVVLEVINGLLQPCPVCAYEQEQKKKQQSDNFPIITDASVCPLQCNPQCTDCPNVTQTGH